MDRESKIKELGHHAAALLQLHLEKPVEWDATRITEKLFFKFEELELEEDPDEKEEV